MPRFKTPPCPVGTGKRIRGHLSRTVCTLVYCAFPVFRHAYNSPRLGAREALVAVGQFPWPLRYLSFIFASAETVVLIDITRCAERLVIEADPACQLRQFLSERVNGMQLRSRCRQFILRSF